MALIFLDLESFEPCLLEGIISRHSKSSSSIRSRAMSRYFKQLAILCEKVLPNELTKFIMQFHNQDDIFKELQTLMKSVLQITDQDSLLMFLKVYAKKIPTISSTASDTFLRYLSKTEAHSLHSHLVAGHATQMDVKNLIMAVKKSFLVKLSNMAFDYSIQSSQSAKHDVVARNRLCQYDWIQRLSENQKKIKQYIDDYKCNKLKQDLQELCDSINQLIGTDVFHHQHQTLSNLMKLLETYAVIEESLDDHDSVLIVKAYSLSLNDIMKYCADKIPTKKAIHFLCIGTFYIDTSIKLESKNLVIVATFVVIKGNEMVCLDVSGKNGEVTGKHREGKHGDETHGTKGQNGNPGKSGGNILICTDEILNYQNLSLVSCGGCGSDGQDGGNGRDGKAKPGFCDDPMTYMHKDSKGCISARNFSLNEIQARLKSKYVVTASEGYFRHYLKLFKSKYCCAYGVSKGSSVGMPDGVNILVGMMDACAKEHYGYVLCKAKQGCSANGGNAGVGGMGGEGGYAGHVNIRDISGKHENTSYMNAVSVCTKKGKNGKLGKTGSPGRKSIAKYIPDRLLVYESPNKLWWSKEQVDVTPYNRTIKVIPSKVEVRGKIVTSNRQEYYCPQAVSRPLVEVLNQSEPCIKFCEATDQDIKCLINHSENCKDGQVVTQDKFQQSESSEMIDIDSVQKTYESFLTERKTDSQNYASFTKNFEELSVQMNNQLQEFAFENIQQQVKQTKRFDANKARSKINDLPNIVTNLPIVQPTCEFHQNYTSIEKSSDFNSYEEQFDDSQPEQSCQSTLAEADSSHKLCASSPIVQPLFEFHQESYTTEKSSNFNSSEQFDDSQPLCQSTLEADSSHKLCAYLPIVQSSCEFHQSYTTEKSSADFNSSEEQFDYHQLEQSCQSTLAEADSSHKLCASSPIVQPLFEFHQESYTTEKSSDFNIYSSEEQFDDSQPSCQSTLEADSSHKLCASSPIIVQSSCEFHQESYTTEKSSDFNNSEEQFDDYQPSCQRTLEADSSHKLCVLCASQPLCQRRLPIFEADFSHKLCASLPLTSQTKAAVELLTIFMGENVNDGYTASLKTPNIIQMLEVEYSKYGSTICDFDLFFVLNFVQRALNQQLSKFKLETLLSTELPLHTKTRFHSSYEFILYCSNCYKIVQVIQPTPKKKRICFELVAQKYDAKITQGHKLTISTDADNLVFFDNQKIDPKTVRVSHVNVNELWEHIKVHLVPKDQKHNIKEIDLVHVVKKFLHHAEISERCKHKFKHLLHQGYNVLKEFPYEVFSQYLPTSWVEQLILKEVQKNFPILFTKIRKFIIGLSCSVDKSLYCAFISLFLNSTDGRDYSCELESDIIKVLRIMKIIFIEQNVCSLVTPNQKIDLKIPSSIFERSMNDELIDCTGIFLPDVTFAQLESFCETHITDNAIKQYFITAFNLQRCIQTLSSNTSLSSWLHELYNLYFCLILQSCTTGCLSDKIMLYMSQLMKRNNDKDVLTFMDHLYSHGKNQQEKVNITHLTNLLELLSIHQWIFPRFVEDFLSNTDLSFCINQNSVNFWRKQLKANHNTVCKGTEIIDYFIKPQVESNFPHLMSVLENTKALLSRITDAELNPSAFCKRDVNQKLSITNICDYTKNDVKDWVKEFESIRHEQCVDFDEESLEKLVQIFAVIRRGVTLYYKEHKNAQGSILPRDTQMIASLLFCQNLPDQGGVDQGTKLMQQISTGEGKTLIICMVAIYKALLGKKVDIVTSSSVLATRDSENQKPLYELFGISVSHCCHDDLKERRKTYKNRVIYGNIGSFQRDILETDFYDKEIRTGRTFDVVIVDEVDSMLVDKGENMLYLPHPIPDMSSLDQVYLEIWLRVNSKDFLGLKDEQEQLYNDLRQKIFGRITPNIFSAISCVDEDLSKMIFQCLIEHNVIDDEDHSIKMPETAAYLLNGNPDLASAVSDQDRVNTDMDKKLLRSISSIPLFKEHNVPVSEVLMILQQHRMMNMTFSFPKSGSLYKYVKLKLKAWIQSAINAKYFQEDKEYIVDIDKRESAVNRYPKIIIMDNETGVAQESAEWGDGLHQFLQLKHNLRLTTESLKAVYMSNITFFSKYMNLLGVTGTLGSSEDRCLFNKLYKNTKILVIPTYKPSRLSIETPVCCSTLCDWESLIDQDLYDKLINEERVVLLICEDIKAAINLEESISKKQWYIQQRKEINMELYVSCHQDKLEEKGIFDSKRLIIATNIAGRGTDIKLSEKVVEKGGLHVLLSFLPPNVRVELQAYGRAARGGEPGTCKMIFYANGSTAQNASVRDCIGKRDLHEASRVADIEKDYYHNVKFQEELFCKFQQWYVKLKSHERPYLDQVLDNWAYFLDSNSKLIESIPTMEDSEIEKNLILHTLLEEVITEPSSKWDCGSNIKLSSGRLLQLAHITMRREEVVEGGFITKFKTEFKRETIGKGIDYDKSIKLYQKVLKQDPFNIFAHYYLACAQFNLDIQANKSAGEVGRNVKQCFYMIVSLFHNKIDKCGSQILMLQIANKHQGPGITTGPYFQEQKQQEMELYKHFILTMDDIIGKNITEQSIARIILTETKNVDNKQKKDTTDNDAALIFWNLVKKNSDKKPHIAKNHKDRLNLMLFNEPTYYTYGSRIKEKVTSALHCQHQVTQNDFVGTLPDQKEFWDILVLNNIITDVEIDSNDNMWGYYNPTIADLDSIDFKGWYITEASFDWIKGLESKDRRTIIHCLERKKIINKKGRLINFNSIFQPALLEIPEHLNLHYKAIKDTLRHHGINWFVLDHLRDCCKIKLIYETDVTTQRTSCLLTEKSFKSVPEILISLNPQSNVSQPMNIHHIKMSSASTTTNAAAVSEQADFGFHECLTAHIPNEDMNQKFMKQLHHYNLQITCVSGKGLNCMINALIQHSKQDYMTPAFNEEAANIRRRLQQIFRNVSVNGMLHCDDEIAENILQMINDANNSKIGKVSVVMASSDGPIIYGGISDERYTEPAGRHVVLWQQGFHYVPIVHLKDYLKSLQKAEKEIACEDRELPDQQLTSCELKKLVNMQILSKGENDTSFKICKSAKQISTIFNNQRGDVFQPLKSRCSNISKFLKKKLKIDFKTLNKTELISYFLSNARLYEDLQKYHVIKVFKMKQSVEEIETKFGQMLCLRTNLSKHFFGSKPMRVEWSSINDFLICKHISKVIQTELQTNYATLDALSSSLSQNTEKFSDSQKEGIQCYIKAICILRDRENFKAIITALHRNNVSSLIGIETPIITLRKLEHCDAFKEDIQEKGDVIGWFADNQCGFSISLAEKKWSKKMFIRSGIIIAFGVVQIAAGIACMLIPAVGTYVGSGLVGEGIGDLIFAGTGLINGYVTWREYLTSKAISLALAAVFGGLGIASTFMSRGTSVSKCFINIFGKTENTWHGLPIDVFAKKGAKEVSKIAATKLATKLARSTCNLRFGKTDLKVAVNAIDGKILRLGKTDLKVAVNAIDDKIMFLKHVLNVVKFCIGSNTDNISQKCDSISKLISDQKLLEFMKDHKFLNNELNLNAAKNYFRNVLQMVMMQSLASTNKAWDLIDREVKLLLAKDVVEEAEIESFIRAQCKNATRENIDTTSLLEEIKNLTDNFDEFQSAKDLESEKLLDESDITAIRNCECEKIIKKFNDQQKGTDLLNEYKLVIEQLEDVRNQETFTADQDDNDVIQLSEYEKALNEDQNQKKQMKRHASQIVLQFESGMKQLLSCTKNPRLFAEIIEHHDTLIIPQFAVSFMEQNFDCHITIVNDMNGQLLSNNSHGQPVVVKYLADSETKYGCFVVDGQVFTYEEYGNNYLLYAMMMGASTLGQDQLNYLPHELRKEIADKCNDDTHSLHKHIVSKSGMAHNCIIEFRLVGAGRLNFAQDIYRFVTMYAEKVQESSSLKNFCKHQFINKSTLNQLGLSVVHIIPIHRINELVLEALESRNPYQQLKSLLQILLPSLEEVKGGLSVIGNGIGRYVFLEVYRDNRLYGERVLKAETIIKYCTLDKCKPMIMTNRNFETLLSILNSAPANLYLETGEGRMLSDVQKRVYLNSDSHTIQTTENSNELETRINSVYERLRLHQSAKNENDQQQQLLNDGEVMVPFNDVPFTVIGDDVTDKPKHEEHHPVVMSVQKSSNGLINDVKFQPLVKAHNVTETEDQLLFQKSSRHSSFVCAAKKSPNIKVLVNATKQKRVNKRKERRKRKKSKKKEINREINDFM